MKRRTTGLWAGATLVVFFGLGVLRLFLIRFETGDIYPPYSSLRADPLGTKALYESLASCGNVKLARNFRNMEKLDLQPGTTFLWIGDTLTNHERLPRDFVDKIQTFIRRGGRLVITLRPRNWTRSPKKDDDEEEETEDPEPPESDIDEEQTKDQATPDEEGDDNDTEDPDREKAVKAAREKQLKLSVRVTDWFCLKVDDHPIDPDALATIHPDLIDTGLPLSISCHTSICFTNVMLKAEENDDPENVWQVLYECDGRPVIVERHEGAGSLVLSTPTFFLSNEAMKDERYPALLAWLVGANRVVIFDEFHHGITESQGVAMLARKYRLHWFMAGLVLLAALFIWRNTASLVPAVDSLADNRTVARGKHSEAGLANLLRRNISKRDLLNTCFDEWNKDDTRRHAAMKWKTAEMKTLLEEQRHVPRKEFDPVNTYNRMASIAASRSYGKPAATPPSAPSPNPIDQESTTSEDPTEKKEQP